jgi:hypothetical protein
MKFSLSYTIFTIKVFFKVDKILTLHLEPYLGKIKLNFILTKHRIKKLLSLTICVIKNVAFRPSNIIDL